jgi:isopenicillin-N N-acyltransferase-like protein
MGYDCGRKATDLIRRRIDFTRGFYRRVGFCVEDIEKIRERHEQGIGRVAPELIEEIRGMAEGAHVPYELMMDASAGGEIRDALRYRLDEGCTTCAATGRATLTHNPIIGHNWDSGGDQESIVITVAKPSDGLRFVTIGPAGRPGCEGMNERGLTVVMSGVVQRQRREFLAGTDPFYVSPLWTHHIFPSCEDVDHALVRCKDTYRRAIHGENWVVGDPKSLAHVEIAFDRMKIIDLETESSEKDGCIMSTTNHYASHELGVLGPSAKESPNSYARRKRMIELMQTHVGNISIDLVKTFFRDHQNPHSICRHGDTPCTTNQVLTVSSEIASPKESRLWIAFGPPCRNEYRVFSP